MSTRVKGAAPPVVRVTAMATLAAGDTQFTVTVRQAAARQWRYNVSGPGERSIASGKVIVTDHLTALRRAAGICAAGYLPGSIERGLLETFAATAGSRS